MSDPLSIANSQTCSSCQILKYDLRQYVEDLRRNCFDVVADNLEKILNKEG